ncbi:hypothetical protein [Frisingicoccus sp.]|uniref:hypothetical protein n=1 Tax=Frisingicoccus sp. TaxID=1918627 RepID=UPI002E7A219A|nr:hypothetical protein [Frisingicoccus sp.]MEE0751544.1 hypothetical protein [Frisingicoccus sp.]
MRTGSHILIHDIIDEHEERMVNLKRYYPFFRLCDHSLGQFKEGRYEGIDMGYVTMSVLRFFIEENNFNNTAVVYSRYEDFLRQLLLRDFGLAENPEEIRELIQYIFDKITNEGRPFVFDYFDPKSRTMKAGRTRLIESSYRDGEIGYTISSDGIAFYLDTKETKDESKISIQQILLEKMIRSRNFKGGVDVIRRINSEVSRLILQQGEIVTLLSHNIFEGMKALEDFSEKGLKWFREEQKLFDENQELVKKALTQAQEENCGHQAMEEIYYLNQELKKSMDRHEALLAACTELQVQADELMLKAKRSRFRRSLDFSDLLRLAMDRDDIRVLEAMTAPLFGLKIKKTFQLGRLEELLTCLSVESEDGEAVSAGEEETYVFEDEMEDERIRHNDMLLLQTLFDTLIHKRSVDLKELHSLYVMKFTENILKNGDYYAFLAHLSQKSRYDLAEIRDNPDTFLEEIMAELVMKDRKKEYEDLKFTLKFLPEERIAVGPDGYLTGIHFERQGM